MISLFSQFGGMSIVQIAIWVVIVAGIIALVWIALRALKITPPPWAVEALWVVVLVVVIVLAIKFLSTV